MIICAEFSISSTLKFNSCPCFRWYLSIPQYRALTLSYTQSKISMPHFTDGKGSLRYNHSSKRVSVTFIFRFSLNIPRESLFNWNWFSIINNLLNKRKWYSLLVTTCLHSLHHPKLDCFLWHLLLFHSFALYKLMF